MSSDDIAYYRERAATERNRASTAPTDDIAAAHRKLAVMYDNLLKRLERAQTAQDLEPLPRISQPTPPDMLQ